MGKANTENGEHLDKMKHFIWIFLSFREALHERSPLMVNVYDDIQPGTLRRSNHKSMKIKDLEVLHDLC